MRVEEGSLSLVGGAEGGSGGGDGPWWWRRRRVPGTQTARVAAAAVLLASPGVPFSDTAVAVAVARAADQPIRVLSVARIYGTALGMQHPGLLPSKEEVAAQEDIVAATLRRIEVAGGEAKGEVVATRDHAKTFLRAAIRYSVGCVVLEPGKSGRIRRFVEGDPAAHLRRHLGPEIEVHVATSSLDP